VKHLLRVSEQQISSTSAAVLVKHLTKHWMTLEQSEVLQSCVRNSKAKLNEFKEIMLDISKNHCFSLWGKIMEWNFSGGENWSVIKSLLKTKTVIFLSNEFRDKWIFAAQPEGCNLILLCREDKRNVLIKHVTLPRPQTVYVSRCCPVSTKVPPEAAD